MQFKTGDTFDISGILPVTVNGVPVTDFTGWATRCQLRTKTGKLIATLVTTWLNSSGALRINFVGSTQAWPVGVAQIDVEVTTPAGDIISTTTNDIKIVQDITR